MLLSYNLMIIILIIIFFNFKTLLAAFDINLNQLKYLADHLSVNDCKHFVASLHYKSFELPRTVSNRVMRLDPSDTCFELLTKWNSGEGKSATHAILATRLRQMGHSDLSSWLSASVFKQLTQRLEDAIKGVEEPEDTDLEIGIEEIKTPKMSLPTDIIKESEASANVDVDDDDEDEVTLAELGGSLVAMAFVIYGWIKLYRRFCKKKSDNK